MEMVGSPAIAAFVAHVAFWVLLGYGVLAGELDRRRMTIMLLLWLCGRFGLGYVPYKPIHALFSSYVAVLDIALVFLIFKGDVQIT